MIDPFHVTSDEINCLIHAYFKDSGFQHSAFVLRAEGRLEHSPHYRKHISRGRLVDLLGKALVFTEVEAHWRGDNMTLNCTNQFKLLERHVCSYDPNLPPPPVPGSQRGHVHASSSSNGLPDVSLKRKASGMPAMEEGPKEKRVKTTVPNDVEVDVRTTSGVEPRPSTSKAAASVHDPAVASGLAKSKSNDAVALYDTVEHADEPVQLLRGHKTEVFVCAWNPVIPTILASGSKDSVVHIWSIPGPDPDGVVASSSIAPLTWSYPPKSDEGDLTSLTWSHDGTLAAVGCYDSVLRICDVKGKAYFTHTQHDGPVFAVRFSPSGRWLVSASLDGSVCIWDVKEKRLHKQFAAHKQCCLDVDWLSDTRFVTSGSDGVIQIMSVDSPRPLKTLVGHEYEVNMVKANPSRTRIASCSDDNTSRIWNVEDIGTSRPMDIDPIVLRGHNNPVSNIAWPPVTPSGEHELIATSSFDGTARLWDSVTGQCLRTLSDHKQNVYALAFSPDGRHIATGGQDGFLYVYDMQMKAKRWSWNTDPPKPGIFEIVWQQSGNLNRMAVAMEKGIVAVVDLSRVPELQ